MLFCSESRRTQLLGRLAITSAVAKLMRQRLVEPDAELDTLVSQVLDAALAVHRALGPGYTEAVYERALGMELAMRQISHEAQVPVTIAYRGVQVGSARLDLLIGSRLVVELKAVEQLAAVHAAQLRSYLIATGHTLGLLINFNVPLLRNGVRRVIRSESTSPPKL